MAFHFLPENLRAAHAAKILKAVTSDSNATEDTKDPTGDAEEEKANLDEVQDNFFSSGIVRKDSVAHHEVAEDCNSHREQPIPSRVTKVV